MAQYRAPVILAEIGAQHKTRSHRHVCTVFVVSHDRHFLNNVCTHIVDIDYTKIKMYVGNYDFWYHSSQLMQRLLNDQNKKREDKIKELQSFIERFSANKSKAKQATARRKLLDKLTVEEMPASSRKYPFVVFNMDREAGKEILWVEGISKTVNGVKVLNNVSFRVNKGDKIAFVGDNEIANTTLFQILMGEMEPDEGSYKWGVSTWSDRGYKGQDYYYVRVVRGNGSKEEFDILEPEYERIEKGDSITIEEYAGAFGIPYKKAVVPDEKVN